MSRLGRNPFEKKSAGTATASGKPLRAAEIIREMNEQAEKATAEAEAIRAERRAERQARLDSRKNLSLLNRVARLVFVDLRAESYLLGIKAYCLSISLIERA